MITTHRSRAEKIFSAAPPETFFLLSAVAQYTGAIIAVSLFSEISPATVAWLRVLSAAFILIAVSWRHLRIRWTRHDVLWVTIFGTFTAFMNLLFYLGIDRLPLGKGVAIEFIGPITVAALRTRTARNTYALLLAAGGVIILGGVELSKEPLGLVYILGASIMWAGYIVAGSRVASVDRGVSGLGLGLLIGGLLITPFGAVDAVTAFTNLKILGGCVLVGLFSNAIGYGIDQSTLRRIPIRRFSVLLALLPVCATVFGFLFLHQTPTVIDLCGMALVLTGVALQERDELDRHPEAVETA